MAVKIVSPTINVDYEDYAGDTLQMLFDYRTDVAPLGAQIDMTGCTARLHVKSSIDDAAPALALTHLSGIVLGGATNNIVVTITPVQTLALGAGTFVYDLELTDSLGMVNTFCIGKIKLLQSVTI